MADAALSDKLFGIVRDSKMFERSDSKSIKKAANSITILNSAQISFSGMDFRRIKINGADLSRAILHKTNFEGADLKDVNFKRAFMPEANFRGTNLYKAKFDKFVSADTGSVPLCLMWFPDGHYLATGLENNLIKIWDVKSGQLFRTLKGHRGFVKSFDLHQDGVILASGGSDNVVRIWNLKQRCNAPFKQLYGHKSVIKAVRFTKDGKQLISAGRDEFIIVWNVKNLKKVRTISSIHYGWVYDIAIDSNNELLYTASADHNINIFDFKSGRCIQTIQGHRNSVNSIAFLQNSKLSQKDRPHTLVTGSADNTIRLWNPNRSKDSMILRGHYSAVNHVEYSPNGKYIISSGRDKTIRIWSSTGP